MEQTPRALEALKAWLCIDGLDKQPYYEAVASLADAYATYINANTYSTRKAFYFGWFGIRPEDIRSTL